MPFVQFEAGGPWCCHYFSLQARQPSQCIGTHELLVARLDSSPDRRGCCNSLFLAASRRRQPPSTAFLQQLQAGKLLLAGRIIL